MGPVPRENAFAASHTVTFGARLEVVPPEQMPGLIYAYCTVAVEVDCAVQAGSYSVDKPSGVIGGVGVNRICGCWFQCAYSHWGGMGVVGTDLPVYIASDGGLHGGCTEGVEVKCFWQGRGAEEVNSVPSYSVTINGAVP